MYTFDPPFTLSAYFTQPRFLIFYQPSLHSSNFIKEIHPSGDNDYYLTKILMIVLSSLARLAKRLILRLILFLNNTGHVNPTKSGKAPLSKQGSLNKVIEMKRRLARLSRPPMSAPSLLCWHSCTSCLDSEVGFPQAGL